MPEPKVRIFVSSPSDLEHERALVKDVIDALDQEYLPYFRVQAILWEEEALTAAQSFQAGLLRPSECEIVLVMLWTRLGTPLAEDPYEGMTGTEWEFVDAVEASARTGSPEVLVYRKSAPRLVDVTNDEATREALADRQRLEAFFRTHFFNPDGSFSRAFRQFSNDRSFRELLETQLRKLLNRRISVERRLASPLGDWHGSPFRATQPFDLGDERIFTGREGETRELVTRLETLREHGGGLLLLSGPSGVGKSSLIRAGLLPRLTRPFLFAGITNCRWCLVELDSEEPLATLASALVAPTLLGTTLDGFGLDQARLTRLLTTEPEVAADQVLAALVQLEATLIDPTGGAGGRQQLVVVIDPLDPLFDERRHASTPRRLFAKALRVLAARDSIWVIATLRSDHLHHLAELPELASLLHERAWFRLEPPPPARIRQVIEIPARIAGIEYEGLAGGMGRGLVDALEAEASLLAYWPPVLQQTLDTLYRRASAHSDGSVSVDHQLLTLSDYRSVGGITGSLIARADAFWDALDPTLRDALPILCRALIALEGGGSPALNTRAGDLLTLSRTPAAARLLEQLIDARLVVAEAIADPTSQLECARSTPGLRDDLKRLWTETAEEWRVRRGFKRRASPLTELGLEQTPNAPPEDTPTEPGPAQRWEDYRPIASFIHPILIDRWQPLREWLDDPRNRRDLILRYQISRQARLWIRTDCNREYLLGESGHAAARRFADAHPDELEPLEQAYLRQSLRHLSLQRRRNRTARILGLTLITLLLVATTTAWWAWDASRRATISLQRNQLFSADNAIRLGNTPEAIRLALNAGPALPVAATETLARALTSNRLIAMVQAQLPPGERARGAAFRDDGARLVTRLPDGGAQLWTLAGQGFLPVQELAIPRPSIHTLRFVGATDTAPILGIGPEGVWRLPAEPTQAPDWTCGATPIDALALSPDARLLALSHRDPERRFAVCILDLERPGPPLWDRSVHTHRIRSLAFSPDGQWLATAARDGAVRLIETLSGQERALIQPGGALGRGANHVVFDAAGERIAVASADERVLVYDLAGQLLAELGVIERAGKRIPIHQAAVRRIAFAPTNDVLVAGDEAGLVVRWSLASGRAEILGRHDLSVEHLDFAPANGDDDDAYLVLSGSLDNMARIWGLSTGKDVAVLGHAEPITQARFSLDGQRVLSVSDQDGSARLWSVEPIENVVFQLPSAERVGHLAMSEAPWLTAAATLGRSPILLAVASFDPVVEVWRHERGAESSRPTLFRQLTGHRDRVRRVAFSASGRRLASAGFDGTSRLWDLESGRDCTLAVAADGQLCEPDGGIDCPNVYRVLFGADERWLLTTSTDPRAPARLWDTQTCQPLAEESHWDHGGRPATAAAMGTDAHGSTWVATGDDLGIIRVIQVAADGSRTPQCTGAWHSEIVTDLALAPAADWLASTSQDGRILLLGLTPTGCGEPRLLEPDAGALSSVRFAPDGKALVTSALNASAQIWALDGTRIAELVGHRDRVTHADFSPDGRWILTASRDGSIRLWSRPTTPQSRPLSAHLALRGGRGGISYATFTPDGLAVASAHRDNMTRLWQIWSPSPTPDPHLDTIWGRDRARLALIREAVRFRDTNRLDPGPERSDKIEVRSDWP